MKRLLKALLLLMLASSLSFAAPAVEGELTFTQPDGTQFKGLLKGDSAMHWIESNGDIIIANPKDKFYYKARLSKDNTLVLTTEKPRAISSAVVQKSAAQKRSSAAHTVSQEQRKSLTQLYKNAKTEATVE